MIGYTVPVLGNETGGGKPIMKARTDYKDPLYGTVHEIISAMSSLNMHPEPMKKPTGEYLSETDRWANHAMEHLQAAVHMAEEIGKREARVKSLMFGLLLGKVTPEQVVNDLWPL